MRGVDTDMAFIFRSLKERCHGKRFLRAESAKLAYTRPSFVGLAFHEPDDIM